ncbi:MAG: DUF4430 domain-containing protein [Eubacteriaceae bacterium]|jgi:hypothetical protein
MKKLFSRTFTLMLCLLMLLGVAAPYGVHAEDSSSQETVTVCMTVEKFTLGEGYNKEPKLYTVPKGTHLDKLITDVLGENNYTHTGSVGDSSGQVGQSFYLASVKDTEGNLNIPKYITDAIDKDDDVSLGSREDNDWLGEFDYTSASGWMYCANNTFPGYGCSNYELQNGDVIRWQYTLYGYGADLDADNSSWGTAALITTAQKDKLTWRVAEINAMEDKEAVLATGANQSKYDTAVAVLENMESTQTEVDNALADLNALDTQTVAGDANGDSLVNYKDLVLVKNHFDNTVNTGENGDVNNDGIINYKDLVLVKNNFK